MKINRRSFIQQSAAKTAGAGMLLGTAKRTAASFNPADSANGRITVGYIGVGARAQDVMDDMLKLPGFEVVGFCDAYQGRLERAAERTKGKAKAYRNVEELLAAPGIDAVYIGTPDHWHKNHAIAAAAAGKDIYIEKPLTYTIDEGLEIAAAVEKHKRILQVGSQSISTPVQQKAREIVASGKLGQITQIRASNNRNSASGAWLYPIPPDANQSTVNWDMFVGPAPKRPFSLERFFRWRCYNDYSGGMATDLFVHIMTTIHFVMNAQAPDMVVATGSLYRWKDTHEVPDTLDALMQYPEGFTVNLSGTFNNQAVGERGIQILGTKGALTLGRDLVFTPDRAGEDNGWIVTAWPSALERAYYQDPKVIAAERPQLWEPQAVETGEERWQGVGRDANALHLLEFQKAVQSRKQPVEDAWFGHRAAAVAHMINQSARQKRPLYWDRAQHRLKA
jgi:predicted dehydrogenase